MPDINSLPPSTRSQSSQSSSNPPPPNTSASTTHTSSPTSHRPNPLYHQNSSPRSSVLSTSNSPRLSAHGPRRIGSISLPPANDTASTTSSRRGSSARNSPSLAAASLPIYADPHHHRQPSLGELHQELEEEQEAQVNRLLGQIREQQAQIAALSHNRDASHDRDSSAVAGTEEALSSSLPGTSGLAQFPRGSRSSSRAGGTPVSATVPFPSLQHRVSDVSLGRRGSQRGSRNASPLPQHAVSTGGLSGGDGGERDEVERMLEESRMVQRENQMLKARINDLERMVAQVRLNAGQDGAATGASNGNGA